MLLTPNPAGRARSLHSSALDSLIEEVGMVAKSEGSLSTSLSSPSPYLIRYPTFDVARLPDDSLVEENGMTN